MASHGAALGIGMKCKIHASCTGTVLWVLCISELMIEQFAAR